MTVRRPEVWVDTTLGEVIEIYDYKRIPLNSRERAKRQGQYPYYGASGIVDYIDAYIFDGRYLLIAEDGENLNSRKTPVAFFANGKFWVNNHAHIVRGIEGISDDYFLMSYIENSDISGYITGAAQPKLSQANLKSIKITLPPYPVQRKIAEVLSTYDDLIEVNTRRIRILEQMAQSVYREWFGKVDANAQSLPEGWEIKKLGDVVELAYGKGLKADQRIGGPYPVYGSAGIVGYHNESLVKSPGIIVGRKGNVGSVFWSNKDFYPIDTTYFVRTEISLYYVFYNLRTQNFINNDAAVPGLSRSQAYSLPFLVPSKTTLDKFDEFVVPIFQQLEILAAKSANLRRTRDLMLPRLVSGEIAVHE